jgi:agmatine deiminase
VPAEWEPQARIWLSWPHQAETWPGHFENIPQFFVDWIDRIREAVPVNILAGDEVISECERQVGRRRNVEVIRIETNDCWFRDYGPTFVQCSEQGRLIGIDWKYNAWGGKYAPWDADDRVASQICSHLEMACVRSELCLEGGALEVDGGGRLLSTSECLITPTRNPGWTRAQVEKELSRQLGVHEILWVDGGGLRGDDTDGHIDQLARFVDPENVVVAVSDDLDDENHDGLQANLSLLQAWAEKTSPKVKVHRLPIPAPRFVDGTRVPESYCNFLRLGPDRLLLPSFGAKTDDYAKGLFQDLTQIQVETIDCREMVWGLGALHCGSRDQPQ